MQYLMIWTIVAVLHVTAAQQAATNNGNSGTEFLSDLAGTFLKALFPEIKQFPHTQADVPTPGKHGTFGPGSTAVASSGSSSYLQGGYPGVRPTIPFGEAGSGLAYGSDQHAVPPPPAAGLSVGGYPIFTSLPSNAIPTGLQGRTDLPASYVYPFAKRGTKVMPNHPNASPFLLTRAGAPPSAPPPPRPFFTPSNQQESLVSTVGHQQPYNFVPAQNQRQPFFVGEQAGNLISRHTAQQYGFDWNDPNQNVPEVELNSSPDSADSSSFIQDVSASIESTKSDSQIRDRSSDEIYDNFRFDYDSLSETDKSLKLGDLLSSNLSEISPLFIHAFLQAKAETELENYFAEHNEQLNIDTTTTSTVPPLTTSTSTVLPSTTTTKTPTKANVENFIDQYIRKTLTKNERPATLEEERQLPVLHEFIDLRKDTQSETPSASHDHHHESQENIGHDPFPRAFRYRILDDPSLRRFMTDDDTCDDCISADLNFIKGSWTQVYGDVEALKSTYSNLASLRDVSFVSANQQLPLSHDYRPIEPACVGLHIKPSSDQFPLNRQSEMALFFRDGKREEYHELTGYAREERGGSFKFELPHFSMPMCVMKAGPVKNGPGDYLVMADTKGKNKCKSFHVFVKNARAFARLHAREVIDYLRQRITVSNAHELMSLPHPDLCQAAKP